MLSKHICQENCGRQKMGHPTLRCPWSNPQKLNVALLCKKDFEDVIKGLLETLGWVFLDSPVDPIWSKESLKTENFHRLWSERNMMTEGSDRHDVWRIQSAFADHENGGRVSRDKNTDNL